MYCQKVISRKSLDFESGIYLKACILKSPEHCFFQCCGMWIRKTFFRIRIRGSVILNYGFGMLINYGPGSDPTWKVLWGLNKKFVKMEGTHSTV